MIGWIFRLIANLLGLWDKLPDSTKAKIVDGIVEAFDSLFRRYFKAQKGGASNG